MPDYNAQLDANNARMLKIEETINNLPPAGGSGNNGKWELIELFAFGYTAIYQKPADWETNYKNFYFYNSFSGKLDVCNGAYRWEPGHIFSKNASDTMPLLFERDKEPNGKMYNFKAMRIFTTRTKCEISQQSMCSFKGIHSTSTSVNVPRFSQSTYPYKIIHECMLDEYQYMKSVGAISPQGAAGNAWVGTAPAQYVEKFYITNLELKNWKEIPFNEGETVMIMAVRA